MAVDGMLDFGVLYTTWMYFGILSNMLIGVRVLEYMKLHGSLRVFSQLLANAWKWVAISFKFKFKY